MKNKIIVIDPSHGGKDRANVGVSGKYVEPDGTLDVAKRLSKALAQAGHIAILTRTKDATLSLSQRCAIAEREQADIFISLHTDAPGTKDAKANGATGIYSFAPLWASRRLAQTVLERYCYITGIRSRGVLFRWNSTKTDDYYGVLRGTTMPAMILEMAFHTNPLEEAKLRAETFREIAAFGIYQGIMQYFEK